MVHDHTHSHVDTHAHDASAGDGRAFAIGILLNLGIVGLEIVGGMATHSMALVSDAAHNASDVLGLGLAWGAAALSKRRPSARRTYGLRRASILAALGNAVLLLVATGGVGWEAIRRLGSPPTVGAAGVIAIATIAAIVNALSALLFAAGRKRDLNIAAAFTHLAGDALIALGVAAAGAVVWATGWSRLDPIVALVVSALVLVATYALLRKSLNLALDAVPEGIDADAVRTYLASLPGVLEVHDLHIWGMSTTEAVLTAHLVVVSTGADPCLLIDVERALHDRFHIEHSTLQIEAEHAAAECRLAPAERV
jgi:cobalt-zinc-cadmium efflux system protein